MADEPLAPVIVEERVTVVQVINEPRPAVASITEFPLVDEPTTDKGYETSDGDRIRVRVIVRHEEEPDNIPMNTAVAVAPTNVTLSLTLSLLNNNGKVKQDGSGRLLISPVHEIQLNTAAIVEGFDMDAMMDLEIRKAAHAFRKMVKQQNRLSNLLDKWKPVDNDALPA